MSRGVRAVRAASAGRVARAAGAVVLAAAVFGCGTGKPLPSPASGGDAASATKQLILGSLATSGLQAIDSIKPYRPSETPSLIGAARSVIQVQLPDDPDHGFIVIYSFASASAAERVAYDQAAYVGSPQGGIQFAPGSHFTIRLVDTTMIFFTWSPGGSPDTRTHLIEDALSTVGIAVPVAGG